jgi:bacterioferritin (cytochrome b1)
MAPHIEPDILQHLNSVLRVQLTAVQQHFIHVLTLKAWGDVATAKGITAIDEIDLPNAMRIADLIVSIGAVPELCRDHTSLAEHMPAPGSSYEGIFAAERQLEAKLIDVLQSARNALTKAETREVAHLVLNPLVPRDRYEQWIQQQTMTSHTPHESSPGPSESAPPSLNALFAHLMVVIEQGLIHSFVHWHGGRKKSADAAWSMSGAAMMQATQFTNCLASHHSAPSPAGAVLAYSVQLPRIGHTSQEALMFDRAIAERCYDMAEKAKADLAGTEFEAICRDSAAYFRELSRWQSDLDYPEVPNPCRGFERVLQKYAWEKGRSDRMSA